jgi:hypothetical protein
MNRKTPLLKNLKMLLVFSKVRYLSLRNWFWFSYYLCWKNQRTRNWITSYIIDSFSIWRSKLLERKSVWLEIKLSKEITLLKLPEQNQTKKETRANGGS